MLFDSETKWPDNLSSPEDYKKGEYWVAYTPAVPNTKVGNLWKAASDEMGLSTRVLKSPVANGCYATIVDRNKSENFLKRAHAKGISLS